ncbi:hypothetical protein G7Y89_g3459 [Cudoniella acicularis]|uniref:RING-type domain-containing protein n=1 Tax=Cudoniella acicularis TaxID=354080 RepID=A0A8H4RRB0_9HELO|nr:hypothetical protein G7Y89_g3459 [Cudoniella acicularis]
MADTMTEIERSQEKQAPECMWDNGAWSEDSVRAFCKNASDDHMTLFLEVCQSAEIAEVEEIEEATAEIKSSQESKVEEVEVVEPEKMKGVEQEKPAASEEDEAMSSEEESSSEEEAPSSDDEVLSEAPSINRKITHYNLSHNDRQTLVRDPRFTCSICHVPFYTPRADGDTEHPIMTPCGHVAGNECHSNWLRSTQQPKCPFCRTSLTFITCKHIVSPRSAFLPATPAKITPEQLPKECMECVLERIESKWERTAGLNSEAQQAAREVQRAYERKIAEGVTEAERNRNQPLRELIASLMEKAREVQEVDERDKGVEVEKVKAEMKMGWGRGFEP